MNSTHLVRSSPDGSSNSGNVPEGWGPHNRAQPVTDSGGPALLKQTDTLPVELLGRILAYSGVAPNTCKAWCTAWEAMSTDIYLQATWMQAATGSPEAALCRAARHGNVPAARVILSSFVCNLERFALDKGILKDNLRGRKSSVLLEPLALASGAGHIDMVRFLLDNGARLIGKGAAAFHTAASNGHGQVVRLLLDHGGSLHFSLYRAAREGDARTLRLLLGLGDVEQGELEGILWAASSHPREGIVDMPGRVEVVRMLLDLGPHMHPAGNRALEDAAGSGHLELVEALLDWGADPHHERDMSLCLAAAGGHLDVVRLLLSRGGHVHAFDDEALCLPAEVLHDSADEPTRERVLSCLFAIGGKAYVTRCKLLAVAGF